MSTLAHIYREEEHLGTYPLEVLPQLVDAGRIDVSDHWFVEGMTAPLPVGDLFKTKADTQEVRVMNFPKQDVSLVRFNPPLGDYIVFVLRFWLASIILFVGLTLASYLLIALLLPLFLK